MFLPSIEGTLLRSMLYAHYIPVRRENFQKFSSRLQTTGVKNTAVLARNLISYQRIEIRTSLQGILRNTSNIAMCLFMFIK
jgi:hypothetical protein